LSQGSAPGDFAAPNLLNAAFTQYRGESGKVVRGIFAYLVFRVQWSWRRLAKGNRNTIIPPRRVRLEI
jgi:hypothetical protein